MSSASDFNLLDVAKGRRSRDLEFERIKMNESNDLRSDTPVL
jgi:hypothetical protein